MNESTRQRHAKAVRQYRVDHPDYQQRYNADRKRLRNETGTAINGTLPVKSSKITYTVSVRRPLTPSERVHRHQPTRRHMQSHESDYDEQPFEPSDFQD